MVVYIDVIISFNFLLNLLVLSCVKWISGVRTRKAGAVVSALFGGIYAVFMFEPSLSVLYSAGGKLIISMLMIVICFRTDGSFIKLLFYFYITAFAFAGVLQFAENFSGVTVMGNQIYYVENSIWVLAAAGVISYFIIRYVLKHMRMTQKRYGEKEDVTVTMENKSITLKGMLDTGNALLDPITLYPVVVVEYESIKKILPEEIAEFLKEGSDLNCNINRKYLNRIRLVPYNSVGAESILKGFRPDMLRIESKNKEIREVIVAVIYDKLSANNEFDAIFSPLIQEGI